MKLKRILTALGLHRSNRLPRPLNNRLRRPLVERLEDRALLAADANLVAYRPVTEYINYALYAVPETQETDTRLGPGIRVNGDDDNSNGQADYLDRSTAASGDNDLVRVDVLGTGTSFSVAWTGTLAVWTTPTKSVAVANGGGIASGQTLWVEYVRQTHTTVTPASLSLTVTDTSGGITTAATDSVVFHSFQSVVIAIGGNSQDPRNFGNANLGTFTMAGTLYSQGYDVHMYSHSQIQSNGRGAAYDEVVSSVLRRNVDYVAILGYSWGGGAVYELSVGLNANTALAPEGYKLQYTAYVDSIRHYSLSAETRKPVGTQYHDNFYQRKDFWLRGNSVSGATNVNVTLTSWGKSLVHTTLDDNATLQNQLTNNLIARVIA